MSAVPEHALKKLRERWEQKPDYAVDPRAWQARRLPQVHLWSKQWQVIESVRDNRQTAVKSCHSAGKSFIAAFIALWWIESHPPGTAFVVTSAPTGAQVKAVLWREMNRFHKAAGTPGRANQLEWYDAGGELVAIGRKPAEHSPDAFQGIHAEFVLVILDEATGIPGSLWDASSSITSNVGSRTLAIGNPDDPESRFRKACDLETWSVIRISAFDTPNFTGEEVPDLLRRVLVSPVWVEEKRVEWTEQSPLWVSKITGEFPTDAEDGVVPASWLAKSRYREQVPQGDVELGLDVSAGGTDRSVIWARQGMHALKKWVKRGEKDPDALALWAAEVVTETRASALKVDANGVGWGVGALVGNHLPWDTTCSIVPVLVSEKADDSDRFLNKRAELWWTARELSRQDGGWDLTAIDDDDADELTKPRYHTNNPRQRIQVEKKEEIIKRLGRSPDSADALILAFADASVEAAFYGGDVASASL